MFVREYILSEYNIKTSVSEKNNSHYYWVMLQMRKQQEHVCMKEIKVIMSNWWFDLYWLGIIEEFQNQSYLFIPKNEVINGKTIPFNEQ